MSLGFTSAPAPDRCETIDGTVRSMHFYQNAAKGSLVAVAPVWVCANCGCLR